MQLRIRESVLLFAVYCLSLLQSVFAQTLVFTDFDETSQIELKASILPEYWQGGLPNEIDIEISNEHPQNSYNLYIGESPDMSAVVRIMDNRDNRITKPPNMYTHENPASFNEIELKNGESYTYKIELSNMLLPALDMSNIETVNITISFLIAYKLTDLVPTKLQFLDLRVRSGSLPLSSQR